MAFSGTLRKLNVKARVDHRGLLVGASLREATAPVRFGVLSAVSVVLFFLVPSYVFWTY